jgi:hypothetical protein
VLLVENGPLGDIDRVTGLATPGEFGIVADLALQADVGDEAEVGLRVQPRQVPGIRKS